MRITEKGQVTIPKAFRDRYGLRPGSEVEFVECDHRVVLEKAQRQDVWDKYRGFLKLKMSTNEAMRLLRGRVPRP